MDKFVDEFANELGTKRMNFPKTIVYVRTYTDCYKIYSLMNKKLGLAFTDPPGYPNIAGYRLADVFSRVQTAEKREEVLQLFSEGDGRLRFLIATTAFRMGGY